MKKSTLLLAAVSLGALASHAAAQDILLNEILITPNRTPTEAARTGSAVSTVTQGEIEAQAKPLVLDYLTLLPGVNVSSPGIGGQETSLSIRGADKKYVKTLFNGIDISDPSATQNQSAYQNILAGGISSIEVLKGSQGTLYGADAVAGVIGISTLGDIPRGIHHEITAEGGSFGTVRGGYRLTGASDGGRFAASIHGLSTDGISAIDQPGIDLEPDAFRNANGTLAFDQQLSDTFSVFGSGLWIRTQSEFDGGNNPPTDNPFNEGDTTQVGGRLGFNADLMDGRFRNSFSAQLVETDRSLLEVSAFGPFEADYVGRRTKFDYQGAFEATDWFTLQFGADHERQTAKVTDNYGTDTDDEMDLTGVWSQAIIAPTEALTLTAGLRHDEHDRFGGYTSYRVTGSYGFGDSGTRLHSSFGTGYRAPSLYELYAPFAGNDALQPEQSVSFDVGVEQEFLDGRLVGDVTYFLLNTEDLIDYSFSTYSYLQIPGTTERQGVEVSARFAATPWLDLGGAYTFTHTEQPDGARRPRVPAHDLALTAVARPAERWEVSATAHAVLDVQDQIGSGTGLVNVAVDDYVLLDAKIAYKPTQDTELYLRGENLLNQDYQVIKGYGMPGAAVFAGFKARF